MLSIPSSLNTEKKKKKYLRFRSGSDTMHWKFSFLYNKTQFWLLKGMFGNIINNSCTRDDWKVRKLLPENSYVTIYMLKSFMLLKF